MLMYSSQHGMHGMAPAFGAAFVPSGNTGIVPPAQMVVATANGPVPINPPDPTAVTPTAIPVDNSILGLSPLGWLAVGGAVFLAWKWFAKPGK